MLSQFIPVEPGSGGGRCCLQGRRCSSRILSNAYGGAVNTTAADGGGFSTVAIDKPIGFLCPNVVGVFSPSELSSTEQSRNTTGMDIRAGPAAGFRGRFDHPAQCRRISRGTGPGFPVCRRASSSSAPHCGGSRRRPAGLLQLFFSPFASLCKAKLFGVIVLTRYLRAWARPETPFAPSGNGAGRSPPGVCKSAWSPSRRPGSVARWVGWGSSMVLANLLGLPRRRP